MWGFRVRIRAASTGHNNEKSPAVLRPQGSHCKKGAYGTTGYVTKTNEYDLTLSVGIKLASMLEERGYEVHLTRTSNNVDITNIQRAQKAENDGAEIFIRLHGNGLTNHKIEGVGNYVPAEDNPYLGEDIIAKSRLLGKLLGDYQCKATGQKNNGVKGVNDMTGINWSTMPVTLVEMGYMSNAAEDRYMADEGNRRIIAKGLADGVDAYFAEIDKGH